jgi:hypothetical protein
MAAVSRAYAAVLRDADRSAWFAPAARAFAIVTRAWQSRRVFCHDSDESTALRVLLLRFVPFRF